VSPCASTATPNPAPNRLACYVPGLKFDRCRIRGPAGQRRYPPGFVGTQKWHCTLRGFRSQLVAAHLRVSIEPNTTLDR
jgi:hypothetical protein